MQNKNRNEIGNYSRSKCCRKRRNCVNVVSCVLRRTSSITFGSLTMKNRSYTLLAPRTNGRRTACCTDLFCSNTGTHTQFTLKQFI